MKKIAIIGAGISGLVLANQLKGHARITVFEKARGVSGRTSTRRAGNFQFDHGAQFFTARTYEFQSFIKPLIDLGVVARWDAKFVEIEGSKIVSKRLWDEELPHYVGSPGMNAIAQHLARVLDVRTSTRVAQIRKSEKWELISNEGKKLGKFDWVISSAPAEQTTELMPKEFAYYKDVSQIKMQGCYSLMLGFEKALNLDFEAAQVRGADISWISANGSKPGRNKEFCMLIHSTNQWADAHMEEEKADVIQHLIAEASKVVGQDLSTANHIDLHKWRYANIAKVGLNRMLVDSSNQLAACGDWCIHGRIEAAFTSGLNTANKIKERLG